MKILINENQLDLIKETINPNEAYTEVESVKTICDGKRGVAFVAGLSSEDANKISDMIYDYNLDILKVPSNPHEAYIIFKPEYKDRAKKLLSIAEKYGGYLHHRATDEDTYEIGKLLEYDEESIKEFIRNKHESQDNNIYYKNK